VLQKATRSTAMASRPGALRALCADVGARAQGLIACKNE
jgi:hypothetical protein